ncbi:MAG: hypothetical protein U5K81_12185 [Trueperaceae bacterium]|nr:hypothetical protein [Trueperaceae bacterium]
MTDLKDALDQVALSFPEASLESVVQAWVYLEDFTKGINAYHDISNPTADDDRWLGVCHFQLVQDDEAQEAFERAIAKGQQAARVNLAHLLRMTNNAERASDELQQVDFARLTSYDQVFFMRVKSIHEETNGDIREALRFAEEAWRRLQGLPEFELLAPSILAQLGILHGRVGRTQRALWFLERGMQLTTGLQHLKSRMRWATVLVAQGRLREASEALTELDSDSVPQAMRVEGKWLQGEIAWIQGHSQRAVRHYRLAIDMAQKTQVVYEEFLSQLALATLLSTSDNDEALHCLNRGQSLIGDMSDRLAYRFREILVFRKRGLYTNVHAIRELEQTATAFSDMGLLQEYGQVLLHVCDLKKQLEDPSYEADMDTLRALAKTLQNARFLDKEMNVADAIPADFLQ